MPIDLSQAPGERMAWNRPKSVVYLWAVVEILILTNAWQPSSRLRVAALRRFGASVGSKVIIRPRTRIRFPWKLAVGDNSWIGEGVWIHNQDQVEIGANVAVSQETFITTGSHAYRTDMALITSPVVIEDGAWVTSRCIVLGGTRIGESALVVPGTVVKGRVPSNTIWGGPSAGPIGERFSSASMPTGDE